jgi:hypothetical protein
MAKKDNVSFGDLVAGLEKNNLKLSASVQAQIDAATRTEKVLSDTKALEASQTSDSIRSAKADDALVKDIHKGLIEKNGEGLNAQIIKLAKTMKEMNAKIPKVPSGGKPSKEQTEGITGLAGGVKTFKGIRERISDFGKGVKDKYGPGNLGNTMLKAVNVGGLFDKRIAQNEFIKQQRELGVHGNTKDSTLRDRFNKRNEVAKDIQKNEAKIEQDKKAYGLNEAELGRTKGGAELLANREKLAGKFGKYDIRSKLLEAADGSSGMDDGRIKAGPKAPAADAEEVANEQAQVQNQQFDILQKIEENTRPAEAGGKGGAESGGGSGIMAGIGKGMQALGKGIGGVGKGIGNALRSILFGLAEGLTALGIAFANPLVTVALAGLTIAAMGIGKALEYAAPAIAAFAPVLMKIAEVIGGVFMAAIKEVPNVLRAIGDIITAVGDSIVNIITAITDSIERLSKIDGTNLLAVGAGLVAVSAGLATFGAANAIAGVGNLVGGFLSGISGQKTPIEQLEQIAGFGPNLNQAGTGVKNLAKGLTEFSSIDTEKIAAISKLPVEKIAAMGAAMNSANAVYDKSGKNKQAEGAAAQSNSNTPNVVSAPTIVNNRTNQQAFVKSPIRNPDNTLTSYIKTRYVS